MSFFAARQPILNTDQSLYAYELLFRDGPANAFPDVEPQEATSRIVDGLHSSLSIEQITDDKPAFVNFTEKCIINGLPLILPVDSVVVEILETARPTRQLLEAVKALKEKGYVIALDDYIDSPAWERFFPYVDIIKLETPHFSLEELNNFCFKMQQFPHIALLAEKIETHEQYSLARSLGFRFFQGYFFCKPKMVSSQAIAHEHQAVAQLAALCGQESIDIAEVTRVFEENIGISVKLLKYVNSAFFRRAKEITGLQQALVILGENELRRFVSLLFVSTSITGKPNELSKVALVRARFCELCAHKVLPRFAAKAFTVGLFSVVNAMFNCDIREVLKNVRFAPAIEQALLEEAGPLGDCLKLAKQYEYGDWDSIVDIADSMLLSHEDGNAIYMEAIEWASERMAMRF